jgi:hypothetical protein
MRLDQEQAERALHHMVESGSVQARDHKVLEYQDIWTETGTVRRPRERYVWHRGKYSLADVRREIRKAQTRERGGEQQPAASEVQPQSRKGVGGAPRKYDWDALGAAFGAWLHDQPGRADALPKTKGKIRRDAVKELAVKLGMDPPDDDSIRPYMKKWLDAYRRTFGSSED